MRSGLLYVGIGIGIVVGSVVSALAEQLLAKSAFMVLFRRLVVALERIGDNTYAGLAVSQRPMPPTERRR